MVIYMQKYNRTSLSSGAPSPDKTLCCYRSFLVLRIAFLEIRQEAQF